MSTITLTLTPLHLALVVILAILIGTGIYRLKKKLISRRLSQQKNDAIQAEKAALKLLRKHDFEILEVQPSIDYQIRVNDAPQTVRISADFIVRKLGYTFVAEVKNGEDNNDITHINTRRQLLEYYMAYGTDGILLVNMQQKQINQVQFDFDNET